MTPKHRILVVDDSREMSKVMSDMLNFKGYETMIRYNGTDAIATALEERPDLILLDLKMPDIDGFEVIRQIQKDEWGKTAKILMLTAIEGVGDIPADIQLSAEDYLLKSLWGIEEVEKKIRQKLGLA